MYLVAILSTIIHIVSSESLTNCSALHAFVEVRGLGINNNTLTSAQALFPPHSYYVPWTELVTLSTTDDTCDPSIAFTPSISNKIVLLFEDIGNCSAHYKVLVAQSQGATAVLMSNTDLTGTVVNIVDDNALADIDTTIPMRSISKLTAQSLSDEITADRAVEIQIGCFDITYPTALCLSDATGEYGKYAGNYQRQEQKTVNGHPIWKMSGYRDYVDDTHIYLHDAHGDDEWFWAITTDTAFESDKSVTLICSIQGKEIADPSVCPGWLGKETYGSDTWDQSSSVNVSLDLCIVPVGDELQTLCVDSLQYTIAGLRGTYTLTAKGEPEWWRQLTDCDERAGLVAFIENGDYGTGYFVVYEALNSWIISLCTIPEELSEDGTYETMKWRPDLCNDWITRNDYDLAYSDEYRYPDDTFNITLGECSTERASVHAPPCVPTETPDTICLSNSSVLHGYLMGEYVLNPNVTGPYYDSPTYERVIYNDALHPDGSLPLYIWWANEAYAHTFDLYDYIHANDWVITTWTLDETLDYGAQPPEYGHCSGWSYGNPAACQGWLLDVGWFGKHYDEHMVITEEECVTDPNPSVPATWPEYICIGLLNESVPYAHVLSEVHKDTITGAFYIDQTLMDVSNPIPQWTKEPNDLVTDDTVFYFDGYGTWIIMFTDRFFEYIMNCDPYNGNTMNPLECTHWYDSDLNLLDNIYLFECTADDVLTKSPTLLPTSEPTSLPTVNERICLSTNDTQLQPSVLEGIYADNGVNTDEYGTIEFKSETETLYIWYHENNWWLSPVDYLYKYMDLPFIGVYGYCRGGERGIYPDCEECWVFFWDVVPLDSAYNASSRTIEDCSFTLSHDLSGCDEDAFVSTVLNYSDSYCINKVDVAAGAAIALSQYIGEYVYSFENDETRNYMQVDAPRLLQHNKINNYWYVGISSEPDLRCRSRATNGDLHCVVWDNTIQDVVNVDNVISIDEQCQTGGDKKKGNGGKVAGIVIGIVLAVICCVVIIVLWFKGNTDKTHQPVTGVENEMTTKPRTATYDMEALNAEENEDDDADNPL